MVTETWLRETYEVEEHNILLRDLVLEQDLDRLDNGATGREL